MGNRWAVPDIMFLNVKAGHILVVDCKGGANVKEDQDGRYARMGLADIIGSARPPCEVRSHTFAYSIDGDHEKRIRAHTNHALLVFGSRALRGVGDFGHDPLTRELHGGVSLGTSRIRLAVYPYSINDSHEYIDARVASEVSAVMRAHPGTRMLADRHTAARIFRNIHPFHDLYSPAHAAELVEVTRLGLERILSRQGRVGSLRAAREAGWL